MVAAGLAGAVRAVGRVRHRLVEFSGIPQRPVHLVGGHVQEAAAPVPGPDQAGRVQKDEGPHHVRLDEGRRAKDAIVHVALGGEVHQRPDVVLLQETLHEVAILDVTRHELDPLEPCQARKVRRIRELVQHQDPVLRMAAMPAVDEVDPMKPRRR